MKYRLASLFSTLVCLSACGDPAQPDTSTDSPTGFEVLLAGEAGAPVPSFADATRQSERTVMVADQIADRGVEDPATLEAMRNVPRHRLVPQRNRGQAYDDRPLPIGHGQTISQPYIVGYMTELLRVEPDDRVLEVGTGSGYQAAVLGQMVDEVVTIEIVEGLAERAAGDLRAMGYENITVLHGDGYFGFAEDAPYDAIVVTAAAEHIPPPLLKQLKPGGRMVIPVGRSGWTQNLMLVRKDKDDEVTTRNLMPVRFVPLTRETR